MSAPATSTSTGAATRTISIAAIPGDGIGPEVVREGLKVLSQILPTAEITPYDLGAARFRKTGEALPASVLEELRKHDAILLGAIGDPRDKNIPSGVLERELLLRLRFELDQHVNLRPVKLFDGVASPLKSSAPVDMLVVREGTEGPYTGNGGVLRPGTDHEVATEVSVNTAFGVRRVVRDAFRRAAARPRRRLTLVHKTNVFRFAGSLWSRTVEKLALEYPSVAVSYEHVDAALMYFVTDPSRFDVIVTDNMFGDILTDLGAAITGGLGLAASGSLDITRQNPSTFEPVHGSAPDLAGHGLADPTATVLSVALMLDHLGFTDQAKRVEAAVAFDLATRDHKIPGRTGEIGDRLAALTSSRR
jgi:3-isopropylmalate dehydrogenase